MIIHRGTSRKLSSNAFQDPVARSNPTKQSAYSDNPREQQMRFIASDCIRKDSFTTTATASSRSQTLVHTLAVFRAKQLLPNQFKTSPTSLERLADTPRISIIAVSSALQATKISPLLRNSVPGHIHQATVSMHLPNIHDNRRLF